MPPKADRRPFWGEWLIDRSAPATFLLCCIHRHGRADANSPGADWLLDSPRCILRYCVLMAGKASERRLDKELECGWPLSRRWQLGVQRRCFSIANNKPYGCFISSLVSQC
ncbi:hypothetical protein BGZ61DRAFT_102801 [Ilyonectria robusta]|uniref:uncharacterized protein n=1 Tax=Ilyonectria robusta TaxID=1079257 RepID=UPI001E8D05D1|nr:uncharacterized protein BGZ61DRAFT_102801 [Ilyonectria robusta]KAH8673038.1 hypothetical protein BGZ61DRAFT_102801 [Ilyonectria robusta]